MAKKTKKTGKFVIRFRIGTAKPTKRLMRHVFEVSEITIENKKNELLIDEDQLERFLTSFPALHDYFDGTWIDDEGEVFGYGFCVMNDTTTALTIEELEVFRRQYEANLGKREKLLAVDKKSFDILEWFFIWIKWALSNSIRPSCHYYTFWDDDA